MKRLLALVLGACLALATLLPTLASAKTVWKVNTLLTKESELGQGIAAFVSETAACSSGELEVQVFYGGQLGKNIPVVMQSLMAGDLDGFIESGNYFGSLDKRFNVLDAPYAFKSRTQFTNFLKSPKFLEMADAIYAKGIKIVNSDRMNWFRMEDRAILMRRPVFTPADLGKQKIRQYQAEMPIQGLIALGANVQVIPWPDVYTALMTGTVDGLETTLSQSVANKHVEAVKFLTILKLYYQQAYVMIGRKAWDSLPEKLRQCVSTAATAGGTVYQARSLQDAQSYAERAKRDFGVTIIEPPLEPFQKLVVPAQQKWIERGLLPKETMDFITTLEH